MFGSVLWLQRGKGNKVRWSLQKYFWWLGLFLVLESLGIISSAWLWLHSCFMHRWAKLREVGTEVQISQSERPLFPVPGKDSAVRSMHSFTRSKERATLKSPSDRGSVGKWTVPHLFCQMQGSGGCLWWGGCLRPSLSPSALLSSQEAETRVAACLSPFLSKGARVGADTPSLGCCLPLTCLELTSVSLFALYLLKPISQTVPKEGSSQNNFSLMEMWGGTVSCHWAPLWSHRQGGTALALSL